MCILVAAMAKGVVINGGTIGHFTLDIELYAGIGDRLERLDDIGKPGFRPWVGPALMGSSRPSRPNQG
jgi:hypothetical protein